MSSVKGKGNKIFEVRDISIDDAWDYQLALNSSKGHLENYLDWAILAVDYSLEQCKQVLLQMQEAEFPNKSFAIVFKEKLVGGIGFGPASERDGLQITYWIGKNYIRKGLCKRALAKVIEISLDYENINFLEIHVDRENVASSKIAKKAGFKLARSYSYESKGLHGLGIMDVYILLTPKGNDNLIVCNSSQLQSFLIPIGPINWSLPEASVLVSTKIVERV